MKVIEKESILSWDLYLLNVIFELIISLIFTDRHKCERKVLFMRMIYEFETKKIKCF